MQKEMDVQKEQHQQKKQMQEVQVQNEREREKVKQKTVYDPWKEISAPQRLALLQNVCTRTLAVEDGQLPGYKKLEIFCRQNELVLRDVPGAFHSAY